MPLKVRPLLEGVLVDLFGTLVPDGPRSSRAPHLHEMARILGADPVAFERDWAGSLDERCRGSLGTLEQTIGHTAGRQGIVPPADRLRLAVETRLSFTRSQLESCGPVLPALDALRSAGLRLAVVSDCSEEPVRLWSSVALGQRIETRVFSCVEGFCKPDPRMYERALDRLGLSADRCVYVGDGGSRELTGAESVGLSAFLYRFPQERTDVDTRYDPDIEWKGTTLGDLRDLLALGRPR
jgi:putative hydrolase of the HAD superfamily